MAPATTLLEIAGVALQLEADDVELSEALRLRYSDFLSRRSPRLRLKLLGDSPGNDGVERDMKVDPLVPLGRYRLARSDLECLVDLPAGEATARVAPSVYAVDALLRVLLTLVLSEEGGLLLHSSGLVRAGRAYLFYGVSGAGKTTITRLAGGSAILSDELVALRRGGDSYVAFGTPFSGEMGRPGDPISAPVAALLRLGRPPGAPLERLDPGTAARSLLRCALYFGGSPGQTGALLSTCLEMARALPVYDLRLRLEAPLWEQLNGMD